MDFVKHITVNGVTIFIRDPEMDSEKLRGRLIELSS